MDDPASGNSLFENHQDKKSVALSSVETSGELFRDGYSLSLVRDPALGELELVLSNGTKFTAARRFEINGRAYVPPKLASSALDAVVFPTAWNNDYETTDALFGAIEEPFLHQGFGSEIAFKAACFALCSWFPECLPAPCLLVAGPRTESAIFLGLLACVVRHGLPLVEINPATFWSLPLVVKPTLVINHEKPGRIISRLISCSIFPGAFLARKNGFRDVSSTKALYVGPTPISFSLGDMVMHLNLLPIQGHDLRLDSDTKDQVAQEFQPQLLAYRARNILKVWGSDYETPGLYSAQRVMATSLGRCVVEASPKIRDRIFSFFKVQQDAFLADRWVDPSIVAVEAFLYHCHTGNEVRNGRLHVGSIAKTVRGILVGRGEDEGNLTDKAMGSILRNFGFVDTRDAKGWYVSLSKEVRRKVHKLARDLNVPAIGEPFSSCNECKEASGMAAPPPWSVALE